MTSEMLYITPAEIMLTAENNCTVITNNIALDAEQMDKVVNKRWCLIATDLEKEAAELKWPALMPATWKYKSWVDDANIYPTMQQPQRRGLVFYRSLLNNSARNKLDEWVEQAPKEINAYVQAAKELSNKVKVNSVDPLDYILTDLATMPGYAPKILDVDKFADESIKSWIQGTVAWDEKFKPWYLANMKSLLLDDMLVRTNPPDVELPLLTAEYVVKNPWIWGAGGSATNMPDKIYPRGTPADMKTKWFATMVLPEETALEYLTTSIKSTPRAFIKPDEIVKQRLVISSDLPLHMKMAVILHYMKHIVNVTDYSDVLSPSKDWYEKIAITYKNATDAGFKSFPLDETEFDHRKDKEVLDIMLDIIEAIVLIYARPGEKEFLALLMKLIRQDIYPDFVYWTKQNGVTIAYEYVKGILSGWDWTALIDTMVNRGQVLALRKWLTMTGIPDVYPTTFNKGDDVWLAVPGKRTRDAVYKFYTMIGATVNPQKTAYGTGLEFLRLLLLPDNPLMIRGYPARMVKSILYRRPGKTMKPKLNVRKRYYKIGFR